MQTSKNYKIISKQNGKILETVGASLESGALAILNLQSPESQTWELLDAGDGYCRILCPSTGKVLDVIAGGTENGAWLHQWEAVESAQSQLWKLEELKPEGENSGSSKVYKIISKPSGKCIEVSPEDKEHLQIWQGTNAETQKWILEPVQEPEIPAEEPVEKPAEKPQTKSKSAKKSTSTRKPAEKKATTTKTAPKTRKSTKEPADNAI